MLVYRKVNLTLMMFNTRAGHSDRARPGPIPNPEVKPIVAAVILTCVSGWKPAVLVSLNINMIVLTFIKVIIVHRRLIHFLNQGYITADEFLILPTCIPKNKKS